MDTNIKEQNRSGILFIQVIIVIIALIPHLIELIPMNIVVLDDAFYYYKTAHNIVKGYGPTFDTYNITNGFHPMWMGVCTLASLITLDKHVYLYLILSINLFLVGVFSFLLLRMFSKSLGLFFGALLVFLVNWQIRGSGAVFSGMETPLYLIFLFLAIDLTTRISYSERKDLLLLGVVFGLGFLARTSFVLYAPVFLCYLIYRYYSIDDLNLNKIGIYLLLPAALIAAPFLIWNYSLTGHFQQISGLVKTLRWAGTGYEGMFAFAAKTLARPLILDPKWVNWLMLIWPLVFLVVIFRSRSLPAPFIDERIVLLISFSTVELAYYFTQFKFEVGGWHVAVPMITVQLCFIVLIKQAYDYIAPYKTLQVALVILLVVVWTDYLVQRPLREYLVDKEIQDTVYGPHNYFKKVVKWIRENVPKDASVGLWQAGYVGYYSDRNVVNVDGVINGKTFYEYLKDGKSVWRYILDEKIDYISNYYTGPPEPESSEIAPYLTRMYSVGPIPVVHEGKQTYLDWYVWKVNHSKKKEDPGKD